MPRVGSSSISISELAISHLASMTFCWFPPERCDISVSMPGVFTSSFFTYSLDTFSSHGKSRKFMGLWCSVRLGSTILCLTIAASISPVRRLSSVTMPILAAMASLGLLKFTSLPFTNIFPESALRSPNIVSITSVRPAPIRPDMPSISP